MNIEKLLFFVEELVFSKIGSSLSTLEKDILKGAYHGQTYEQIADGSGFSPIHVKMVGAALWDKLSKVFEQKIYKKNLRSLLERELYKNQLIDPEKQSQVSLNPIAQPVFAPNQEIDILGNKITNLKLETQPVQTRDLIIREPDKNLPRITDLELPSGPLDLKSPFYIKRLESESLCYQIIEQDGSLLRIKAPQKTGKTSLTLRIIERAIELSHHNVYLNFQLADSKICQDLEALLKWFCANVSSKLQLPHQIDSYWDDILGYKMSCNSYFEDYLLRTIHRPLVLVLDKIDYIFAYPEIAEDFFALLRAWYEEAKTIEVWKKLRLVLVYASEVYLPLNINQSPFNVGVSVELPEFSALQIRELASRYNLNLQSEDIEQITALVGGHPYLIQIAMYHLARTQISVAEFLELVAKGRNPYNKHLQKIFNNLQQKPELAATLEVIIKKQSEISQLKYPDILKLNSMGLIKIQSDRTEVSCQLYRQFFSSRISQLI